MTTDGALHHRSGDDLLDVERDRRRRRAVLAQGKRPTGIAAPGPHRGVSTPMNPAPPQPRTLSPLPPRPSRRASSSAEEWTNRTRQRAGPPRRHRAAGQRPSPVRRPDDLRARVLRRGAGVHARDAGLQEVVAAGCSRPGARSSRSSAPSATRRPGLDVEAVVAAEPDGLISTVRRRGLRRPSDFGRRSVRASPSPTRRSPPVDTAASTAYRGPNSFVGKRFRPRHGRPTS